MKPYLLAPADVRLIRKEIETIGESVSNETLERIAAIDKLRIELEAIRETLDHLLPGFEKQYEAVYQEIVQRFDPEKNKTLKTGT